MEKIAVILPVYKNDSIPYMILSIDSILKQENSDVHLYVGVDGPVGKDMSDCLHTYEQKTNVTVCWFPENRGLAIILNDLLDICFKDGYEYIARMDADDIAVPNRMQIQLEFLKNNPEIDVVGGAVSIIGENGDFQNQVIHYPATPEECRARFAKRNPLAHPAVIFRKSYFNKAGCKYRPEYRKNQDTLLWYDGLLKNVNMANVPDVVLNFRQTGDMFKNRRGKEQAKKQLESRLMINKGLHYGFMSDLYAYAIYILMISPSWVKRIIYRLQ